jgi:hypothetical protein
MRRWTQKLALVLATGYILFFYSERVFWSFPRSGDKPVDAFVGHIPSRSCLFLMLMPVAALAVYTPVAIWRLTLPTNWVFYVTATPLGFLCLLGSLWVLHRGRR